MKKIMIALAVAAMAVASQAAQISWGSGTYAFCNSEGNPTATLPSGSALVLCNLGQTFDYANAVAIPTQASEGTTVTINTAASRLGRISGVLQFTYGDGVNDLVKNGDYLALMVQDAEGLHALQYTDGTTVGAEAAVLVSGIVNNSSSMTSAQGKMGFTGNFMAESVSEPTSGLLMLLGMAGLALRSRRA